MAIAQTPAQSTISSASAPAARRQLQSHQIGRLLVLPALVFAILVTQAPFLLTILYSFQRWTLNRPDQRGFVGFDNYTYLLTRDPAFYEVILNTVIFVVGSVLCGMSQSMYELAAFRAVQGIGAGGSADAVLAGMAAEAQRETQETRKAARLRINQIREQGAWQNTKNLLNASQFANRSAFNLVQQGLRTVPLLDF